MQNRILKQLILVLIVLCIGINCQPNKDHINGTREITDFAGRTVLIPDSVKRVVCIRPGCMRLVTMAGGIDYISGVEATETNDARFTHTKAYPEINAIPVIGDRFGGDPELIYANNPDVIFMSSATVEAANALQEKVKIPVIVLEGGDMGKNYAKFSHSMNIIGETLGTTPHTDSLLAYIDQQKEELKQRTANYAPVSAYVGAITYKGERDLTATDPYYPALTFLGVDNVASDLDSTIVSPITGTFVDYEKIIDWNPDYIFVDRGGVAHADRDFRTKPKINSLLDAYRNSNIYVVWPYNNYHNNFEAMLLNAWYMGKCIYPEAFADVSIRDKGNEIFIQCYGRPIYDEMEQFWGSLQQLDYQSNPENLKNWQSLNH